MTLSEAHALFAVANEGEYLMQVKNAHACVCIVVPCCGNCNDEEWDIVSRIDAIHIHGAAEEDLDEADRLHDGNLTQVS